MLVSDPDDCDRSAMVAALVDDLLRAHPDRCSRALAITAAEREIADAVDAVAWCGAVRASHAAHVRAWRAARSRDRRAYVPHLHIWLRDRDYLAPPDPETTRTRSRAESVIAAIDDEEAS
ncbi:MAG: hypothetical protein KIT09_02190 [Bryobacteraceae bacterium]|nr:hypothetical protein [Bryobacteraceae bacterium]